MARKESSTVLGATADGLRRWSWGFDGEPVPDGETSFAHRKLSKQSLAHLAEQIQSHIVTFILARLYSYPQLRRLPWRKVDEVYVLLAIDIKPSGKETRRISLEGCSRPRNRHLSLWLSRRLHGRPVRDVYINEAC